MGWAAWRKVRVCSSCPQGLIHLRHNTTPAKIILSEKIICFSWRRVSTKSIYRENIQRLGQEKRGCYRVKLSLQWVSVGNEGSILNKESRWSDRPSFHKLHQRAQVYNNLSSVKQLILDFSRPILMFRSQWNEICCGKENFILVPPIIIYPKMPKCRDWVLILMFSSKFNI